MTDGSLQDYITTPVHDAIIATINCSQQNFTAYYEKKHITIYSNKYISALQVRQLHLKKKLDH
jgi:hypothetical protein